jgi:hypothetical protein
MSAVWKVSVYRDDSTTPVVYDNVKHVFWTAGNTVLIIAQYTHGPKNPEHEYIQWPRERLCWFKMHKVAE